MIIASKNLGKDEETELDKRLDVHNIHIDAKNERVVVTYDIVLVSPTGVAVSVVKTDTYIRYNRPEDEKRAANMKFDELKESELGQAIIGLITLDLEAYDGKPESLAQD